MISRLSILSLLRIGTFFVFLGRGYQHIFWDAPYRTLFWDEELLGTFIPWLLNTSWDAYSTNPLTEKVISSLILAIGIFYIICAFCTIRVSQKSYKSKIIIVIGGISLTFLAFLSSKSHFFQVAQALEHSSQFCSPFLLLFCLRSNTVSIKLGKFLRIAVSLTFLCHGLYAIGFYHVPGKFIDMTIAILGVSEESALIILKIAGAFDILFAIAIFVSPPRPIMKSLLFLAFAWGLATSLARIVANFHFEFVGQNIHQWLFEVAYRVPHALYPLLLFLFYDELFKSKESESECEKVT